MTDAGRDAALAVVREAAWRLGAAARLESMAGDAVLRSVVDAAVSLIRAEAASIALHDATTNRLVFRVAAGARGAGVVGLEIGADEGVAGYVFSTGQPLAIGEAASDPRFGRGAAEQTGYVPRSLIAVPLGDDAGTLGVLEVLDRRDGEPFDLRDLDAAAVFARQATVAIRATRLERDAASLLAGALASLDRDGRLGAEDAAALVAAAVEGLDDDGAETWALADAIVRIRAADPGQLALVRDILDAVARRAERPAGGRFRPGRRG
ncbi:MAG TPA: GAF domain-containing protein [Candidatus Limnocylindrales bacterium]|nr:GAF domain-containing protein [Candidatus Limnocylindrales bacterium]